MKQARAQMQVKLHVFKQRGMMDSLWPYWVNRLSYLIIIRREKIIYVSSRCK